MENTPNSTANKLEILLEDIKNLEIQISGVKDNMNTLEGEEKQENYKKNFLEVRKDNLSRSIESFQNESKKTDKKLEEKLAAFSKLSTMEECYDKLLDVYREKYFPQDANPCQENLALEERMYFKNQTPDSEQEIDKLRSIIDKNSSTIKNYLEEMHYVIQ